MTASDDAKFERARREAGHIEAFARIVPHNDEEPPQGEGSESMEAHESRAPDERSDSLARPISPPQQQANSDDDQPADDQRGDR